MNYSFLRTVCLMVVALLTTPLRAQTDYFWSGNSNTDFFNSANWVGGLTPSNSLASRVNFTAASYSNQPSWNQGWNLNGFVFGDGTNASGAVTLTASSQFVLLNSGGITMNSNAGAVTFNAPLNNWMRIAANQTWLNNSTNVLQNNANVISGVATNVTLTFAGTGRIAPGTFNQITGNVFKVISMSGDGVVAFGQSDTTTLTTLNSGRLELNGGTALGTGGLTINGGTLSSAVAVAIPVNLSGNNAITINNNFTYGSATTTNRTMNLGGGAVTLGASVAIDTFSGDLQIGGAIGDGGNGRGITKTGAGTLTLAGANTYSGNTTVTAGSLILGSSGSVASSSVLDVASGAALNVSAVSGGFVVGTNQTLRGSGSVVGNTTINGALQPGSSPGLLSFSNNLTLGSTAVTTMEINSAATRGTTFDAVNVGGLLTYDGALSLSLGTTFGEGNYSFDLFDFTSQGGSFDTVTLEGSYAGLLTDNGFGVWNLTQGSETWTFTQSSGVLALGVVPEPSTYALLTLAAAGLGAHVVRRRRSARGG